MAPPTHQTVKLSKGRHKSPREGACVMELASMLAGEPFSDHPASVCPVIGAFLRRYNDTVGDKRRQALYRYAALVVGTHASEDVRRARLHRVHTWTLELRRRRRPSWFPERWRTLGLPEVRDTELLADRAAHEVMRRGEHVHAEVLSVLDELIAIGAGPPRRAPLSGADSGAQPLSQVLDALPVPSARDSG